MSDAILDVKLKPSEDTIRLEWGMAVHDDKWRYPHEQLQVRLYIAPYPELSKPTVLDFDLSERERSTSGSVSAGVFNFGGSLERGSSEKGVQYGPVSADALGRYYPVMMQIQWVKPAAESAVGYVALEWAVKGDWFSKPFSAWAVFGHLEDDRFIPDFETEPFSIQDEVILPDVELKLDSSSRRIRDTVTVFVSYKRDDMSAVIPIVNRLAKEGYDIWLDEDSIPGGARWQQEIAKGIQKAAVILFMASPAACASRWCRAEIKHAQKHKVPIIPIKLFGYTAEKHLQQVELDDLNWVAFDERDQEKAWHKLIHNSALPPILERNRRMTDPKARQRHERYLRRLFARYMKVSLADITDDPPKRGVNLSDIYVPLPVDMSVTIKISDKDFYTINDWWVKTERSETVADDAIPEQMRDQQLHEWPALRVGKDKLTILIQDVERQLKHYAPEIDTEKFRAEQNWYMEAHDAAAVQPRMVLTGNPGSGKSTFLRFLTLCLAGEQLEDSRYPDVNVGALEFWPIPTYTPVFIELRDLVNAQFPDTSDPAGLPQLEAYLENWLKDENLEDYYPDLRQQMLDGDCLLMFDGLDEVPRAVTKERRDQIIGFMDQLLDGDYHKCRVIVTSRPYAYNGDWQLDDFGQTTLIPLFPNRLFQLAQALFKQIIDNPEQVNEEAKSFVQTLEHQIEDVTLRNTPLLFTLMAALWLKNIQKPARERLPQRISDLYRESVNLMLERWIKRRTTDEPSIAERLKLRAEQLRQVLEMVAYEVQSEHGSDNRVAFRQGTLIDAMEDVKGERYPQYGDALDFLERRAGLLTSDAPRRYRFTHLSFQEHLAACYLSAPQRYPAQIISSIQASPGRWRNVVPLLIDEIAGSKSDLQPLLDAIVQIDTHSQLDAEAAEWEMMDYVRSMVQDYGLNLNNEQKTKVQQHLVNLLTVGGLAPVGRAAMGRWLNDIGDPRPGVTVIVRDGLTLPDIDWVEIPAGKFIFGDDNKEDYPDYAKPADRQELELNTFYISRYPITYAQFQTFLDAPDGINSTKYDWFEGLAANRQMQEQYFKYSNHPREMVNWYQAMAFCRWWSYQLTGKMPDMDAPLSWPIRLPTEQEWEKAARGTQGLIYPYGDEFDATKGNTREGNKIGQTSAVGIYPQGASPYGVLDMSGNVFDWCLTAYEDGSNKNMRSKSRRVLRGGSWDLDQRLARAAYRDYDPPLDRSYNIGLRVVRSAPIN